MQPRTLELYDILGVLPEFLELANTDMGRRRMYELPGGLKSFLWSTTTPGTPHVGLIALLHSSLGIYARSQTNPVSISQELHEGLLREYLSELNVSLRCPVCNIFRLNSP
jgi:hypothetical protein